ncbi:hypothetical protein [Brevibacillus fortis]|uniref:hypothetical protein n=1 Tax=Brevibacillus fortis TaxID=2126352 RepID=UPI001304C93F|nr:hypothetical protein [Brevibacillus fortis]
MKVSKLKSGQEVIIRLGKIADAEAFFAFVHRVSGDLSFGPQEFGHRNRLRSRPSGF